MTSGPGSSAASDRALLADVLLAAGPEAPTLCEGWVARDLAVHLVARDAQPHLLAGPVLGRAVPRVGRAAAAGLAALRALPYPELVQRLRCGPPRWSPARLPPVEQAVNGVEFYVHAEDVRRAEPGWAPGRPGHDPGTGGSPGTGGLRPGQREQLWRALRATSGLHYRRSPTGVALEVPHGPRALARRGEPTVVLTGQPEELLLHAFGRRAVAAVQVSGPDDAVAAFEAAYPRTR